MQLSIEKSATVKDSLLQLLLYRLHQPGLTDKSPTRNQKVPLEIDKVNQNYKD